MQPRARCWSTRAAATTALPLLDEALEIARSVADDDLVALVLRQLGRARSRTGDSETGLSLLTESRALFDQIGSPDEVLMTGVAIAEAVLLVGDTEGAVRHTGELLEADGADELESELRALRGFALLRLGRHTEAVAEFHAGAPTGRSTESAYGYALNCLGLAQSGVPDAETWRDRGTTVLRQLSVVALPVADPA